MNICSLASLKAANGPLPIDGVDRLCHCHALGLDNNTFRKGRHPRERGDPVAFVKRRWISPFAGMTILRIRA
jgi:hypothetical protein